MAIKVSHLPSTAPSAGVRSASVTSPADGHVASETAWWRLWDGDDPSATAFGRAHPRCPHCRKPVGSLLAACRNCVAADNDADYLIDLAADVA